MNDKLLVKIDNLDYTEIDGKYIIYNVPIVAELVQPYSDGMAYKPVDEIQKIKVDNVPVVMRDDVPSHPDHQLGDMTTDYKAKYTVGYLSEPSHPNNKMDSRKRYADYVLYKNSLTDKVMDAYKKGVIIDTSIGFKFDPVVGKGKFDGVEYDYKQTNIVLDHNAILMDAQGRIGQGRMPSPIGGIGADSNNGGVQMESNDEIQKELDSIKAENDNLKTERDKLTNDAVELNKQVDSLTAEVKTVKDERDAVVAKLKEAEDAIQTYIAKDKAEVDAMREELSKSNPDMREFFTDAKDDLIRNYHKKLSETQNKKCRDIGADMSGNKTNQRDIANLQKTTKDWIENTTSKDKGE